MTERERTDFAGMSLMQDESIPWKNKGGCLLSNKGHHHIESEAMSLFTESEDFVF